MKKIYLGLFILSLLSGCGHAAKKTEAANKDETQAATEEKPSEGTPAGGKVATASGDEGVIPPPAAGHARDSRYKKLSESLNNKDWDQAHSESIRLLTDNPNDILAINALALLEYKR